MKLNPRSFKNFIEYRYRKVLRLYYIEKIRKHFPVSTTIICNNCFGARISQELHLPYNSPTVGLFIRFPDYILFLEHLKDLCAKPLSFREKTGGNYPIGVLHVDDREIEIHFLHYKNNEEASEKWRRRCNRMDFNNLLIIGSETDSCSLEDIVNFSKLPYKNKIFFTKLNYSIYSAYCLQIFKSGKFTNLYAFAHCGYKLIWEYIYKSKK